MCVVQGGEGTTICLDGIPCGQGWQVNRHPELAFPTIEIRGTDYNGVEGYTNGMTLRDWFATHAPEAPNWWMTCQLEHDQQRNPLAESHKPDRRSAVQLVTEWAFKWADAMIAARGAK